MAEGKLTKLTIEGYKDADGKDQTGTFTAQINPNKLKLSYGIQYVEDNGVDDPIPNVLFGKADPQQLSFDFILDATGAYDGNEYDIEEEIKNLKNQVYYYIGDSHQTPYARIIWNNTEFLKTENTVFTGRLTSMNIEYTLFSPDGIPLRAKVSLSFKSALTPATAAKSLGKSSPDLTHLITVKAGDNLPQMCKKIYGDSKYYTQVAAINKLTNFRYLKPGIELVFPPLN